MKKSIGFSLIGVALFLMTGCSEDKPTMNDKTNKNMVEETEAATEEDNDVEAAQQDVE